MAFKTRYIRRTNAHRPTAADLAGKKSFARVVGLREAVEDAMKAYEVKPAAFDQVINRELREARTMLARAFSREYPGMSVTAAKRRIVMARGRYRRRVSGFGQRSLTNRWTYAALVVSGRKLIVHAGRIHKNRIPKRGITIKGKRWKGAFLLKMKDANIPQTGVRKRIYRRSGSHRTKAGTPIRAIYVAPNVRKVVEREGPKVTEVMLRRLVIALKNLPRKHKGRAIPIIAHRQFGR